MDQPAAENRPVNRPVSSAPNGMRSGMPVGNTQTRPTAENRPGRQYFEMPAQRRPINGDPQAYNRTVYGNPANVPPMNGNANPAQTRSAVQATGTPRMSQVQNMQGRSGGNPGDVPVSPRVRPKENGVSVHNRPAQQSEGAPVTRQRTAPAQTPGNAAVRNRVPAPEKTRKQVRFDASDASDAKTKNVPEKAKLGKTRVTDISSFAHRDKTEKAIKKKTAVKAVSKEKAGYDEGGNTIVSVVKAVIYMIFVVVVSVFLSMAIILVGNDVFGFVKSDVAVNVKIPENATFEDITEILAENNIINYPEVFKLYGKLKKEDGPYVAGDFLVSPLTNYGDLMDAFKPKPKSGTSRITIPEGYTTDEIIDLLVAYGIGTREGYEDVIRNYEFDYWFLNELEEAGVSEDRIYRLDGYLFPDTYDFYNSSSEVTVLNKLLKRFDQLFTTEYREQCEVMGYTVDEIITLASLIEKEAGSAAEFFNVSSVFHNRLKNAAYYPCLESDATIVYAIHHETGERPKTVNTSYDTPYNTYFYKGLPPGPIANPSASAILAALSPAQTKYYFFVSDGNTTYFSETKAQHDQYIAEIKAKNQ